MVPPEPATASHSRALYAQQIIQQVAYSWGGDGASGSAMDGWMGLWVGAEGVLWGVTSGFVQGEWDGKYSTLDWGAMCRTKVNTTTNVTYNKLLLEYRVMLTVCNKISFYLCSTGLYRTTDYCTTLSSMTPERSEGISCLYYGYTLK
jgi:hypothetical protein